MEIKRNMDTLIVEAIQHYKARKKRASVDLILFKLKKENYDTNIEDFKHYFDKMEACGIIMNKKPNTEHGSYVICDEKTVAEKYFDNDVVKVLKEEINFLKEEIKEKNTTITKLLALNKAEKTKGSDTVTDTENEEENSVSVSENLLTQDGNCKPKESDKLGNQLSLIRRANHERFLETKTIDQIKEEDEEEQKNKVEPLPVKDEFTERKINGVMVRKDDSFSEKKTNVVTERRLVKKKSFRGYHDNHHYYTNEPKTVILHTPNHELLGKAGNGIPETLLRLKSHIEKNIPHATVILPRH